MFIQALHYGRILHGEGSGEAGGLVSKDTFEKSNPSSSLSPEVSVVHSGSKSLPGSMCPKILKVMKSVVAFLRERENITFWTSFSAIHDLCQFRPTGSIQAISLIINKRKYQMVPTHALDCVLGFSTVVNSYDHVSPRNSNRMGLYFRSL